MEEFDFIAIGDITTDAFIRLKEATVSCDEYHEHCNLCVRFGDKIPFDFDVVVPAVGNSPNAAVSAARLGLKTALITNLGADEHGERCIKTLEKERVDTSFVKKESDKKSNYHYVLWYEDDRTILIKHEDYIYELPDIGTPKYIYLSSLGEAALALHDTLADYLEKNPTVKLAFQPGTFQMKIGTERLRRIYQRTQVFFANKEEYQRILNTPEEDPIALCLKMHELGPKTVVLTDGPKGAYASDGVTKLFMPPYPDPKPPYERTGAGDAFASTVTAALVLGKTIDEALSWGPVNSMSVVQKIGAQEGLLSQEAIAHYLQNAPTDYIHRLL